MRVVITGAAGRIGRCLMEGLSSAGHDVRGIDVVAAGGGDVVVADLARDADALAELMDGADAVVHLAAIASETESNELSMLQQVRPEPQRSVTVATHREP